MTNHYTGRPAHNRPGPASGTGASLRRVGALLLTAMGLALGVRGQQAAPQFFKVDGEAQKAASASRLATKLRHLQALTLDVAGLRTALAAAPLETQAGTAPLVLALPLPDGRTGRFAVREAPVMAPALAAKFPQIKTYAGIGLDDATASVRLDLSPQGFHAQVLTSGGNSFYIDPVSPTDARHYLGFYHKDMDRTAAGAALVCGFKPTADELKASVARQAAAQSRGGSSAQLRATGSQLRTFRLALANTPEYAVKKGNTVAGVIAGEVATVNRVTGVYEKELAVRLQLVANNDQLVFIKDGRVPKRAYTDDDGGAMLVQNQFTIDSLIGTANYDIGHVVSTGGGGVASLGVVCNARGKARGVTGSSNPVGDAFDIDYVAHEMGHQFSGNHPFNGNGGSCAGGNRNPNTAWEPGSGTTIMAYAGICGTANNLQPNSDPTFHTGNYQEMRVFIDGITCGTTTPTGNTAPVVTAPASGKTLPFGTPFKLTATATDAENDALTYSWEELDLGSQKSPTNPQSANDNVALFRSFNPTTSGTRYFPRLSDLLANTTVIGERLPTVDRSLKFRCTARDEHVGSAGVVGGVDYSPLVTMAVTATAGPFLVTAPNTAVTWVGASAQSVTWNVANTNIAPVSSAQVNIRLSLDGGLTYPTVLAANEANDGSAVITVPTFATAQTQARLMIESADNYFFDISNANFTISPTVAAPTISSFTPPGGPVGTVVTILGSNLTGATAVSFNGTAATVFAASSATQVTATVPAGATTGPISIVTPAGTATSATPFVVGLSPIITSFAPTSGPVGTVVVITGTNFTQASQVTFNGANAPTFTVNSDTQITATVPAGAISGPISVTTPVSTGVSTTSFVVIQPPFITSFTPGAGIPGAVVVLTGNYFTGASLVTFNGIAAPGFVVNSPTQLTVTVPPGTTTGALTVTTPGGVATAPNLFITNDLCANAIPLTCGQSVVGSTVGSGATGDPKVTCTEPVDGGGVLYSITGTGDIITVSTCSPATDFDTKLFVYSGDCGAYTCVGGNDDVRGCTNLIASAVTFNSVPGTKYLVFVSGFLGDEGKFTLATTCTTPPPAPTITGIAPASAAVGATVTLTGTDFTGATRVTFNGTVAATFRVTSATSMTAVVPVGARTGNVIVTTPGGASNGSPFTVTVPTASARANPSEFSVWPNPVAGKGTLNLALATSAATATATLRNVLGQTVAIRTFGGTTTELPMTGLATGTYLLTVQVAGRAPSVQRVVVE